MDDVQNPGAGTDQIADKGATEPTAGKTPEGITKADFEVMLKAETEKLNRVWQSRLDTVIGEKQKEVSEKLTIEQKVEMALKENEQIRAEREAERLNFTREKAKLSAKIDDELESAIRLYGSSKADEITSGADGIRAYFEKLNAAHEADKQKAIEEALKKVGAQPRPQAGKDQKVMTLTDFNKLTPKERAEYMAAGGAVTD